MNVDVKKKKSVACRWLVSMSEYQKTLVEVCAIPFIIISFIRLWNYEQYRHSGALS